MATPEPEPGAYEPRLVRIKMRGFRGAAPGRAVGTLRGLAFVIAVKGYKYISPLDNSVHDADDFAALLKRIGFEEVLKLTDETAPDGLVTKNLMKKHRRELLKKIDSNTVVVFFFAGHGITHASQNYLLCSHAAQGPVDW